MQQYYILLAFIITFLAVPSFTIAADNLFFGVTLDGYPLTHSRLQEVKLHLGLSPRLIVFFMQWPEHSTPIGFPQETISAIRNIGAIPCLTWEPMFYKDGQEVTIAHERITSGEYDHYIDAFASSAKKYGKLIIIRFAHEMNLSRYHWGTDAVSYGRKSPEMYRAMYRYVVNRFRRLDVSNVRFAFCPNAESLPSPLRDPHAVWNTVQAYYPGDDVVDYLGMDGYNWGTTQTVDKNGWQSTFRSFENIFSPLYTELKKLAPSKPMIVFETASTNAGGDLEEWIDGALQTMVHWGIKGFCWFEVNKELDWRMESKLSNRHRFLINSLSIKSSGP